MRLAQLRQPLRAAVPSIFRPAFTMHLALRIPRLQQASGNVVVEGRRHASVKAQGAYRVKPKRTHPKKLGAKRIGDQFVIPGNIIYTQRGTLWWPGENCFMGRNFSIHASVSGYVKYYRDPARHPDRKYIGVVFDKADTLPYPAHAERKRRLLMRAVPRHEHVEEPEVSRSGIPAVIRRTVDGHANGQPMPDRVLRLRKDYSYREDNWRLGQMVQTAGLRGGKYTSRHARLRHRRFERERMIEGEKKAAERRLRDTGDARKAVGKVAAKKKAGKKGKAVAGKKKVKA